MKEKGEEEKRYEKEGKRRSSCSRHDSKTSLKRRMTSDKYHPVNHRLIDVKILQMLVRLTDGEMRLNGIDEVLLFAAGSSKFLFATVIFQDRNC